MIRNPASLYWGCPLKSVGQYKLRLISRYLLEPLAEVYDFTITSAYRSGSTQAALYALDPKRAARKAKGISQHLLGEAVDIVPEGSITECYLWILDHLRPWQAILEYTEGKPECIHLSLPSERPEIAAQRLLFIDPAGAEPGHFEAFSGRFPVEAI